MRTFRNLFNAPFATVVLLFGVMLIASGLWVADPAAQIPAQYFLLPGAVFLICGLVWVGAMLFARVVTAETGLTVCGPLGNVALRAPWSDITRYELGSNGRFLITAHGTAVALPFYTAEMQALFCTRIPQAAWFACSDPPLAANTTSVVSEDLVDTSSQGILFGYPVWLFILGVFLYKIWKALEQGRGDATVYFIVAILIAFAIFPLPALVPILANVGKTLRLDGSGLGITKGARTQRLDWKDLQFASVLKSPQNFRLGSPGVMTAPRYRLTVVAGNQTISADLGQRPAARVIEVIRAHAPASAKLYMRLQPSAAMYGDLGTNGS